MHDCSVTNGQRAFFMACGKPAEITYYHPATEGHIPSLGKNDVSAERKSSTTDTQAREPAQGYKAAIAPSEHLQEPDYVCGEQFATMIDALFRLLHELGDRQRVIHAYFRPRSTEG